MVSILALLIVPGFFLLIFLLCVAVKRIGIFASYMLSFFVYTIYLVGLTFIGASDNLDWLKSILVVLNSVFQAAGMYMLIGALLLNARIMLKREKHTLPHMLSLLFAIALLILTIVTRYADFENYPIWFRMIYSGVDLISHYYLFHVLQYLIATVLVNMSHPKPNQNYIIVHGTGLIKNRVSPLLASRVDRAIAFYNKQKQLTTPPKLIVSGGRGGDEQCSEASAMRAYALEKGVPESDILMEDASTTTYENMRFSKKLMEEASGGGAFKAIFCTSNYHVFRTGIYARKAGMRIYGIGARTAPYFLPVAVLREYIAFVVMHKKWNIILTVLLLVFAGSLVYFSQFVLIP